MGDLSRTAVRFPPAWSADRADALRRPEVYTLPASLGRLTGGVADQVHARQLPRIRQGGVDNPNTILVGSPAS